MKPMTGALFLLATCLACAQAQDISDDRAILAAHNAVRARLGEAPLRWSQRLAASAQGWAVRLCDTGDCRMTHSDLAEVGENLSWATGVRLRAADAVGLWSDEAQYYDHAANRCARGQQCGHYTQMVWHDTSEIGCGMARRGWSEVWVCHYYPPGNYVGERPY